MNGFTFTVLAALAAGLLLEYWLLHRQARSVRRHRDRVPAPFAGRISPEAHRKAADYTLAGIALARVQLAVEALLLLGWTLGGGLELADRLWRQAPLPPVWQGAGLLLTVQLVNGILELPLALWHTFGIETRFGFNRTTPRRFLLDRLLAAALLVLLGGPLAALMLWILESAGPFWWLWAWAAWMGFTLLFGRVWPTLIAPLFNRFTPLEDDRLRTRLEKLLARTGFRSGGMYVMDGSRRSTRGNAYFTGLGRTRRIVFFDTLLERLEPEEIEAVLAHELGHFRHHHLLRHLAIMAAGSLAALALLDWLLHQPGFYTGLGLSRQDPAAGLALFLLVLPQFTRFLAPLFNALSRRHEYQADAFAAEQADPRALVSALVKLYRDNAATLTPDPLYSAFHHGHPPAPLRIARLSSRIGGEATGDDPA